jgi:hypothetical protein
MIFIYIYTKHKKVTIKDFWGLAVKWIWISININKNSKKILNHILFLFADIVNNLKLILTYLAKAWCVL